MTVPAVPCAVSVCTFGSSKLLLGAKHSHVAIHRHIVYTAGITFLRYAMSSSVVAQLEANRTTVWSSSYFSQ